MKNKFIILITSLIAGVILMDFVSAQCSMCDMMYGVYGFWPMSFWWVFSILVLIILILLII